MTRKIIIDYVYPPIPVRGWDYLAYFDGDEEGLKGWGATEKDAVQQLINQLEGKSR
jgi:hypothetical protein